MNQGSSVFLLSSDRRQQLCELRTGERTLRLDRAVAEALHQTLLHTRVSYTHLALGCRIDGGQAEYVRVPYADQGLTVIPDRVSDRQALFAGDVLATGYWAAKISEIRQGDTVLILGAGPTGICTMLCTMPVSYTHLDVYKRQSLHGHEQSYPRV